VFAGGVDADVERIGLAAVVLADEDHVVVSSVEPSSITTTSKSG
jgi:hypothetical protein